MWLKLRTATATKYGALHHPAILLLGGESAGDPSPFLRQLAPRWPPVRMCGAPCRQERSVPREEDPLAMAEAAGGIVHHGWSVEQALESMPANRTATWTP